MTALVPLLALAACGVEGAPSATACDAPTGAGTVHEGAVTADEVWAAADGPHTLADTVHVDESATLIVEACAEVRVAEGASLIVHGNLLVKGEAERPITFYRDGDGAWGSLAVHHGGSATLAHVTLSGGGGGDAPAALHLTGDGDVPERGLVAIDQVTIEDAEGIGVLIQGATRFVEGSDGLFVTGAGDWPVMLGQHALDTLPGGDLRGNARDAVRVLEDLGNGYSGLQRDATMKALTVPYVVGGDSGEPFLVGGSDGAKATLTIEAGAELRFQPGTSLRVQAFLEEPRGTLVAEGAADAPVVFTSNADAPAPGDWANLWFEAPLAGANRLSHVEIAYAGGWCSCFLTSCSPLDAFEAAVIVDGVPASAFLADSTIRDSAGHGVVRSWVDHADLDFAATNTFDGIAGCAQTMPELSDEVCPDERFACRQ